MEVDPLCETAHVHMAHLCLQKNDLESAVASYDLAVGLLRMKQARSLVITHPPLVCPLGGAAAHEAGAIVAILTVAILTMAPLYHGSTH